MRERHRWGRVVPELKRKASAIGHLRNIPPRQVTDGPHPRSVASGTAETLRKQEVAAQPDEVLNVAESGALPQRTLKRVNDTSPLKKVVSLRDEGFREQQRESSTKTQQTGRRRIQGPETSCMAPPLWAGEQRAGGRGPSGRQGNQPGVGIPPPTGAWAPCALCCGPCRTERAPGGDTAGAAPTQGPPRRAPTELLRTWLGTWKAQGPLLQAMGSPVGTATGDARRHPFPHLSSQDLQAVYTEDLTSPTGSRTPAGPLELPPGESQQGRR